MAYTKTAWVEGGAPGITAANLNKIEQGISDAHDHIVKTNNPHNVTSSQINVLTNGSKGAGDPATSYPVGVTTFYVSGATGWPTTDGTVLTIYHSTYRCQQFFYPNQGVDIYSRIWYNGIWENWAKTWNSRNDSALAKTTSPTFSGTLTAQSMTNSYGYFTVKTYSETNYGAGHTQFWYNPNDRRLNIEYRDGAGANVVSELYSGGNKVWTAGNDGSGSGLDADLLDGNHASVFLKLSGGTLTGDLQSASSTSGAILDSFFNIKRKTGSSGSWNILNDVGTSLFRVSWDGTGALLQKGLIIDNVDDVSETDTDGLTIRGALGKLQIDDNEILSVDTNNNLKNLILNASSATLNGKYVYAAGLNVTWGTATPSGGGNGDIYIQY